MEAQRGKRGKKILVIHLPNLIQMILFSVFMIYEQVKKRFCQDILAKLLNFFFICETGGKKKFWQVFVFFVRINICSCKSRFDHKRLKCTTTPCSKQDQKHSCFPPGEFQFLHALQTFIVCYKLLDPQVKCWTSLWNIKQTKMS